MCDFFTMVPVVQDSRQSNMDTFFARFPQSEFHMLRSVTNHKQMLTGVSSSEWSIWCLPGDMLGYERAACSPTDAILRPENLIQVHMMKIGKSRTFTTPLESSHRAKSMVPGSILGTVHDHYGLRQVQFWHKWEEFVCAYVFWSPGIVYLCSRKEMRWFITYWKPLALRDITNAQQISTSDS